jgi:hypothetical protein
VSRLRPYIGGPLTQEGPQNGAGTERRGMIFGLREHLSLHHDISTLTGEEVLVFTLAEAPRFREMNKK